MGRCGIHPTSVEKIHNAPIFQLKKTWFCFCGILNFFLLYIILPPSGGWLLWDDEASFWALHSAWLPASVFASRACNSGRCTGGRWIFSLRKDNGPDACGHIPVKPDIRDTALCVLPYFYNRGESSVQLFSFRGWCGSWYVSCNWDYLFKCGCKNTYNCGISSIFTHDLQYLYFYGNF